jgi:hypothetical protein
MTKRKRPESMFLRSLYRPLIEDCRREVEEALKVTYALECGMGKDDIAAKLDLSLGEVKGAVKRIDAARERLEQGPDE